MRKHIVVYLIYSLLICCTQSSAEGQYSNKEDQPEISNNITPLERSNFRMEIQSDSGKIIIESLVTKEFLSDYHFKIGKPIIERQSIFFVNPLGEEKLVHFNLIPVDSISSLSGKSYVLPEAILLKAKAINTKSGVLYSFYGGDQMRTNKEFFGITNTKGQWLWYYYGSVEETNLEFGDHEKLISLFGERITSLAEMIKVIP